MKEVIDLQIVYIFTRDDVDLLVPLRIEFHHHLELLPLLIAEVGKIFLYSIYHHQKSAV